MVPPPNSPALDAGEESCVDGARLQATGLRPGGRLKSKRV
jgi:hypothetical protein